MNQINSQIEKLTINREEKPTDTSKSRILVITITLTVIAIFVFLHNQNINAKQTVTTKGRLSGGILSNTVPHLVLNTNADISYSQPKNQTHVETKNPVLDASGHIVARRITTVSSRVTGKITQLNIEEGQLVKSDEILAELDAQQAEISRALALADLASAQASLEELLIAYQHEIKLLDRRVQLEISHVISKEIVESSASKTKQMAAKIKNHEAQVNLAEQRLALASYQLEQHQIRAPFDGVVISKNAQVGELISAGSSGGGSIRTGVGTIVDMDSLEIEVEVGEGYINRVFKGQQVRAKLDAYPNWQISSEVVAIIPTADRQKASIKVRVRLLESDPRILPDMGVKVSFMGNT